MVPTHAAHQVAQITTQHAFTGLGMTIAQGWGYLCSTKWVQVHLSRLTAAWVPAADRRPTPGSIWLRTRICSPLSSPHSGHFDALPGQSASAFGHCTSVLLPALWIRCGSRSRAVSVSASLLMLLLFESLPSACRCLDQVSASLTPQGSTSASPWAAAPSLPLHAANLPLHFESTFAGTCIPHVTRTQHTLRGIPLLAQYLSPTVPALLIAGFFC